MPPTLSDLPLELFTLVVSTYVRDADLPEIFRARAVSRTFAKTITQDLLSNGAKIVHYRKPGGRKWYAFFVNENRGPHEFLKNNAVTLLYNYVHRRMHTKPLLPIYIGAIADDLIQGTLNVLGKPQFTHGEVTNIRNTFILELCHAFIELNPGQVWSELAESPSGGYSLSVHKSLAIAACVGHVSAMRYFLTLGADPYKLEYNGFRNAFRAAACTGKADALRLLFAYAANESDSLELETTSFWPPFSKMHILQYAIEDAVKCHHHESALLIKDFALTQLSAVDIKAFFRRCVKIAVRYGHVQLLTSLFGDDRPILAVNPAGRHPMAMEDIETACELGHVEFVRYLLQTNLVNSTMFRSDFGSTNFSLLRIAICHGQCRVVDLFYENGARPVLQHLIVALNSKQFKAFTMVRHLIQSGLSLQIGITVPCNDLAVRTIHDMKYYAKLKYTSLCIDRVKAVLFLATELKKQDLLDLTQDLRGLFELCEYVLSGSLKISNTPVPFTGMAKSIRGWLKRKAPMFQPQSTRVLRSHARDTAYCVI